MTDMQALIAQGEKLLADINAINCGICKTLQDVDRIGAEIADIRREIAQSKEADHVSARS